MNTTKATEKISASLHKLASSDKKIHNAYLLVHSDKYGYHLNLAEGKTESSSGQCRIDRRVHVLPSRPGGVPDR